MMRFFLIDHALDCPVCDKSGGCKMQDFTYEYHVYNNPFPRPKRPEETRHYSPLIAYKLDRCVVCAQCVRVCDELVGATAITMADRGYNSEVVPAFGNSLLDTNCTHCGNCVAVCPVPNCISVVADPKANDLGVFSCNLDTRIGSMAW